MEKISEYESKKQPINWNEITHLRYLDWSITTPMMLIVLCAALAYNIKKSVHFTVVLPVIILNYVMLYFGYIGEDAKNKTSDALYRFIAFFFMYGIIFYHYIRPIYNLPNYIFYGLYLVVWTFYGIVYFLDEETKNMCFNILDVISKCFIGIGLWFYYTKIIT